MKAHQNQDSGARVQISLSEAETIATATRMTALYRIVKLNLPTGAADKVLSQVGMLCTPAGVLAFFNRKSASAANTVKKTIMNLVTVKATEAGARIITDAIENGILVDSIDGSGLRCAETLPTVAPGDGEACASEAADIKARIRESRKLEAARVAAKSTGKLVDLAPKDHGK